MPLLEPLKKTGEALRDAAEDLIPTMRIELLSDRQAVVEGCRGILEYSDSCIRLSAGSFTVRFRGEGLLLRNFGAQNAVVEGRLHAVEFC